MLLVCTHRARICSDFQQGLFLENLHLNHEPHSSRLVLSAPAWSSRCFCQSLSATGKMSCAVRDPQYNERCLDKGISCWGWPPAASTVLTVACASSADTINYAFIKGLMRLQMQNSQTSWNTFTKSRIHKVRHRCIFSRHSMKFPLQPNGRLPATSTLSTPVVGRWPQEAVCGNPPCHPAWGWWGCPPCLQSCTACPPYHQLWIIKTSI